MTATISPWLPGPGGGLWVRVPGGARLDMWWSQRCQDLGRGKNLDKK